MNYSIFHNFNKLEHPQHIHICSTQRKPTTPIKYVCSKINIYEYLSATSKELTLLRVKS